VVRFWSLPDGRPRGGLRIRDSNAETQLSPDARLLSVLPYTSKSVQTGVEVWDVRDRRRVTTLPIAAGGYMTRWSPDGRRLAVADARGRVQVYSTATWKPVTAALTSGRAAWLGYSPDGRTLAAGNTDGTVSLWDAKSGQALGARLPGIPQSTPVPFFTPGSTSVIAAQDNGRAVRWDIRPASLAKHACDVAGRRLTRAEWNEFLPGRDYDPAC
jgi:WD40 repeat protein